MYEPATLWGERAVHQHGAEQRTHVVAHGLIPINTKFLHDEEELSAQNYVFFFPIMIELGGKCTKSQTSFFFMKMSKGYYVMPFSILYLTNIATQL